MTVETFLEKFELLADTPNAIPNLRELVLQLAVRGHLVDPLDEESCDDQLEALEAFRRENKRAASPDDQEVPFAVPGSWNWVQLGDAMEMFNGRAFKPAEWS